jgi:parallel beta-helix repeat protein
VGLQDLDVFISLLGRVKVLGRFRAGLVSGVWAFTILVAVFGVVLNVPSASGQSGTIYIRADGSIDPPDAPISTVDNVTYTFTGNITSVYDGIVVERSSIIIDGNGYTLQGSGYSGTGIDLSSSNVTVKSANIKHFYQGIIISSNNTRILNNKLIDNCLYDIGLSGSSNNTLSENNMTNARLVREYWAGIRLYSSSNNSILGNTFVNGGLHVEESYGNLVKDNLVNGKPLVYLEGMSNQIVDNAGQVILINCDNISVQNLDLSNTIAGLQLWGTNSSKITNNNVTNNGFGMRLYPSSSNNSIIENNVINNYGYGISLLYSSNSNIISQNNIVNNGEQGISLYVSSGNTISGNNITGNMWVGIDLYMSSNNNVSLNHVADNGDGIELYGGSSNNNIYLNNVENTKRHGIRLFSSNNVFYHNNFINNTQDVYIEPLDHANSWDDGYPSGGNYWSDYIGADEFSGSNQDQPGSDGIGDTPYVIDEDNQDRYPFMNPWPSPEHELVVSVTTPTFLKLGSSSSLAAIVFNKGLSEETDVELRLITNGTIANSTIVSILHPGDSYTLNYLWTPTVGGIYNVTAYAAPVPGETLTENNQQTIFVNVSAPELVVSIMAPASLRLGTSSSLNVTVSNQGLSNENTAWGIIISGPIVETSQSSISLQAGESYTFSYSWTPRAKGTYNVTAYVLPVPGETSIQNNQMTRFVTVDGAPSTPSEVQVGVKTGDWIKVDYTITGWPAGTPYPLWLKVEFLSVEGTSATVRVTMRMSDGAEQNATVPVDVVAGGQAFGLSGFAIPANLTTGDIIYMSGYGNVTIAGETTRNYAGAGRTVVYTSFSQYGTQLTYYWDKHTGVMVEASTTSGGMIGTAKATETNMWQAAPSGLPIEPIYLYILAALALIIVVGATVFIVRRKRKPPEEVESSQSKLRLTRAGFRRNFGHRITRV